MPRKGHTQASLLVLEEQWEAHGTLSQSSELRAPYRNWQDSQHFQM